MTETPPPPPPARTERLPAGYRIRADLDAAVREYQAQTSSQRNLIIDQALEEYFERRGLLKKKSGA